MPAGRATRATRATGATRATRAMPATTAALVALASLSLAGCGADVERAGAARAADAFTASATADPGAACAVLAPRTLERLEEDGPCARALATAGLPEAGAQGEVSVAGHSAQVRYAADTVFLSLFADGWRVTAAGCRDRSADDAVPYDCSVDGG